MVSVVPVGQTTLSSISKQQGFPLPTSQFSFWKAKTLRDLSGKSGWEIRRVEELWRIKNGDQAQESTQAPKKSLKLGKSKNRKAVELVMLIMAFALSQPVDALGVFCIDREQDEV